MNESIGALTPALDPDFRKKRKRAILSAWAGFALDSYSIFIVVSTLLPALVYFQGDMSAQERSIFAGMTLAVTLLGRPSWPTENRRYYDLRIRHHFAVDRMPARRGAGWGNGGHHIADRPPVH
ncbi:hypothetical protein [Bradyrhizobium sp. Leo170]|uniref:hypothetical protein n=1 Tax=Bradyrhizobium sp. Leo170 TaxID=1571199 RepID=UPI001FDFDA64|nr:hypothetical protein [Bradyrhizobium sp. Leo170]